MPESEPAQGGRLDGWATTCPQSWDLLNREIRVATCTVRPFTVKLPKVPGSKMSWPVELVQKLGQVTFSCACINKHSSNSLRPSNRFPQGTVFAFVQFVFIVCGEDPRSRRADNGAGQKHIVAGSRSSCITAGTAVSRLEDKFLCRVQLGAKRCMLATSRGPKSSFR